MEDDRRKDLCARLRERLAALEHDQWCCWTGHMFDMLAAVLTVGGKPAPSPVEYQLAVDAIARWKRQVVTAYAELAEKEKDSDREWADKVLALLLDGAREW